MTLVVCNLNWFFLLNHLEGCNTRALLTKAMLCVSKNLTPKLYKKYLENLKKTLKHTTPQNLEIKKKKTPKSP
jgi:predicted GTPase